MGELCANLQCLIAALAFGSLAADAAATDTASQASRVAAWAPSVTTGGPVFTEQTVRMVIHPSVGGSAPRLRLSNLRGSTPLRIGHATLANQANGASIVPGSLHALTVRGATRFTIPAGSEVWTDPVPLAVVAERNMLLSLYLPGQAGAATWHSDAFDTSYAAAADTGDHAADIDGKNFTHTSTSWYDVSALTVESPLRDAVVAFGDSITDGYHTPIGAYARWPDFLGRRLAESGRPMAVVDAGIGGNRVLTDVPNLWQGISALKRFDHDVLSLPRVHTVILLEGINDIGNDAGPDGTPLVAQALVEGYRQLIRRAHAAGLRIVGCTLLPGKGSGYFTAAHEDMRQAVNRWIRSSGEFDGVIDFDRAMRDPADAERLRADYDSGDHLHPNAAGMQAMANAIDLRLL